MAAGLVDADLAATLKEFKEAKAGVKGLVDSGITTIPLFFHQPNLGPSRPPCPTTLSIPIVDLSLPRATLIDRLLSACRNPGFFQLINHGIPRSDVDDTISAFRSFYQLPADVRSRHFSYDRDSSVTYSSNVDIFGSTAAWVDSLRIHMGPVPPDVDMIPEACRKELLAWDGRVKTVAAKVLALLCEGLGVAPTRLDDFKCLEKRHIVANYYPCCPEPERTIGFKEHTDTSLLTVLIQDRVGGLQVKMRADDGEEYWVDVKPVPGALVVNVGDLFQIISNDEYKSGAHRVLANPHKEARVAIVTFFSPTSTEVLGPLPELISKEHPPKYKNFNMVEYFDVFFNEFNQKSGPKLFTDHFKIST